MSRLIGSPGDRWSLSTAVDALVESARRAAHPGGLWLAGLFYPSLAITSDVLRVFFELLHDSTGLQLGMRLGSGSGWSWNPDTGSGSVEIGILTLPLMLVTARLVTGLAYVSGPEIWDKLAPEGGARHLPRLKSAWRAGRGQTLAAFGLWLSVQGLTLAAVLLTLGPIVALVAVLDIDRAAAPLFVLLSPLALLLFAYGIVLQVVNQLALNSLACNRRGVASAMGHAWRLMRNAPWAVVRGAVVDVLLTILVAVAASALTIGACLTCVLAPLTPVILAALSGLAGVVRAGYWARFYRALGGLTPSDPIPGLEGPLPTETAEHEGGDSGTR